MLVRKNVQKNTLTGVVTGENDQITFYHGLMSTGRRIAPDDIALRFTSAQDAAGTGRTVASVQCTLDVLPLAGDQIRVNQVALGGLTDTFTWAVAATQPYEVTIGADTEESIDNLIAAFHLASRFPLRMVKTSVITFNLRGANYIGGDDEYGHRTAALTLPVNVAGSVGWASADMSSGGGAGQVAGAPEWSIIANTSSMTIIQVRGLQPTDSLNYELVCRRLHSSISASGYPGNLGAVSGADLATTAGSSTVTSAALAAAYTHNNEIEPGTPFIIADTTLADSGNNGSYRVLSYTAATGAVVLCDDDGNEVEMPRTYAHLAFGLYSAGLVERHEAGRGQVAFGLPSLDDHQSGDEAVDVELPGAAIEAAELSFEPLESLPRWPYSYIRFVGDGNADLQTIQTMASLIAYNYTLFDGAGGTGDPTAGNTVGVDMTAYGVGPWTDANTATALVAAINGHAARDVDAVLLPDGESFVVVAITDTATNLVMSTTIAGAIIDRAAGLPGRASADSAVFSGMHLVNAEEVLKLAIAVDEEICIGAFDDPTGTPRNFPDVLQAYDVNGAVLPMNTYIVRIVQVATDNYVILLHDPLVAAQLAADSEIYWTVTCDRA